MKNKLKILCLRTCPHSMFLHGMELLKSQFPDSSWDLFVQKDAENNYKEFFEDIHTLKKPFFTFLAVDRKTFGNIIRKRYDVIAIFYNNNSEATYETVKKMAFLLFPKKVLGIFPDGRLREVQFSDSFCAFSIIRNNTWLDGIIAGGMIALLYMAFSIYTFSKKRFIRGDS